MWQINFPMGMFMADTQLVIFSVDLTKRIGENSATYGFWVRLLSLYAGVTVTIFGAS